MSSMKNISFFLYSFVVSYFLSFFFLRRVLMWRLTSEVYLNNNKQQIHLIQVTLGKQEPETYRLKYEAWLKSTLIETNSVMT